MHRLILFFAALGVTFAMPTLAAEQKPIPTKAEMALARDWIVANLAQAKPGQAPPFSFVYDGKNSGSLLVDWHFTETTRKLDKNRTQRIQTYTDPATGLRARVVLVEYSDFPTVEWTVYLRNTGKKDTPIVENVQAADFVIRRDKSQGEFILHHALGAPAQPSDYQPIATLLGPGETKRIATAGGRPCNVEIPYFNIEYPSYAASDQSRGMIIALGWPGQWASSFERDSGEGLRVIAGQELTHFTLHPGEEVRTPLVAVQFWKGGQPTSLGETKEVLGGMKSPSVIRAQNIWRRWMIAHSLPRPGGKPLKPTISFQADDFFPNYHSNAADVLKIYEGCVRERFDIDWGWIDAGWYPCPGGWWVTGDWRYDPERYPNGIREVSDWSHKHWKKFALWMEPERVSPGQPLAREHPEWLLGGVLVNLGNPDAWKWVLDTFDRFIVESQVDSYRQDFNMDPLDCWRSNDTPDRQGITEIKYIQGLYSYWTELKKRHPNMYFDTGGRRFELETMRWAVPISKSEHGGGTSSTQCQTYGISFWLPFYGGGTGAFDTYTTRSNIAPWSAIAYDTRKTNVDFGPARRHLAECRLVGPYFWGDYYPLTPYTLAEDVWIAWQFNVPDKGTGVIQAFRRPENQDESVTLKLHQLDRNATYELSDCDSNGTTKATGADLMEKGLTIKTMKRPWAAIVTYRKT